MKLALQNQKTIILLISIETSLNIQIYKYFCRSNWETTILASFASKSSSCRIISSYLQKLSTLTIAKFAIFTRTHIILPKSLKKLRANTRCSAFCPDSRKYKSIDKLIGNVYCPDTMCSDILCVHKKTFQCSQCSSTWQVHNNSFKEQKNSFFFWSLLKGYTKSKGSKKQCKLLLVIFIVLFVQTKSVFTCQTTKILVFTTVRSANPALTCLIFLSRTKNQHICCWMVIVHITLKTRWPAFMKNENFLHFWRNSSATHNQAHSKLY